MSLHLTYTGVNAGTYLCLRYRQQLGAGSTGRRLAGDTAVHFAYAAPQLLTADTTCPDCRHVATCPTPDACTCCAALGYQSISPAPSTHGPGEHPVMFSGDEDHGDDITSPEMPRPRYPLDETCPDCRAVPGEPLPPRLLDELDVTEMTAKTSTRTKSRRPMTETARAEAAEARAAKLDALHEDLAAQVETLSSSEGWVAMLHAAARFRAYSLNNSLLIALQLGMRGMDPDSRVAGFTAWKSLGRSVIKGEKGLAILAPCTYRKTTEANTGRETSPDATAAEPQPETSPAGKERKVLRGFKVAYVFAQVQTEGKDLPALLTPPMLTGQAPAGLWDGLAEQVAAAGYTLQRGDCGSAEGYTDPKTKTVRVRDTLDDAAACAVLAHELAHALLHCAEGYDYAGHRGTAEIEAESVAFLVTTAMGLPSGTCAAPYVAGWAGGDVAKVKAAAQRVVTTAHAILDRLDGISDQADAEEEEEQAAA